MSDRLRLCVLQPLEPEPEPEPDTRVSRSQSIDMSRGVSTESYQPGDLVEYNSVTLGGSAAAVVGEVLIFCILFPNSPGFI